MTYKDFEDYLQTQHCKENPTILDDDLPDSYGDWVENLSSDEWIFYAQKYADLIKKEYGL